MSQLSKIIIAQAISIRWKQKYWNFTESVRFEWENDEQNCLKWERNQALLIGMRHTSWNIWQCAFVDIIQFGFKI